MNWGLKDCFFDSIIIIKRKRLNILDVLVSFLYILVVNLGNE
uniref:Uncharacterized protein n=1 Tax=Rhizophora mucronata TaxID=61149 RepID=A0A2P2IHY7_RHIMU